MKKVRWGILGTGNIASKFAEGLAFVSGAEISAVGSRTRESAEAFGARFSIPRRFGSYEELAAAPDIDVVYVATPHPLHHPNTLLCLRAGKSVLCEKPFTMNAKEARELVACAREQGLFLMEAMWTRFFPIFVRAREVIASGALGEIRTLMADIGFQVPHDPESRIFNPALGGGALLDIGIYPVSLSSMIFGRPARIAGLAHLGTTGVDEQAGFVLGHDKGELAVLCASFRSTTPREANILGTRGNITLHQPFWYPRSMTIALDHKAPEHVEPPFSGNGYNYIAEEVVRCISAGKLESDVMPLRESIEIMETLDAIRAQWGLRYPGEV